MSIKKQNTSPNSTRIKQSPSIDYYKAQAINGSEREENNNIINWFSA